MSEFILVKFEDNWADEMDVAGFVTYEKAEWSILSEKIKDHKKSFTVCIGTNEELEYDNGTNFLEALTIVDISKSQYNTLKNLFGGSFGETSALENIKYIVDGN